MNGSCFIQILACVCVEAVTICVSSEVVRACSYVVQIIRSYFNPVLPERLRAGTCTDFLGGPFLSLYQSI